MIRCAVVGCGVIAPTHLSCLAANPDAEVAMVCDLDLAKAKAMAEQYGVARAVTDAADVFAAADVDAVHICTDHASHAPLAAAAFAAGKHVLCEKPLASDPDGLRRMLDAHARRPDRAFGAIFQHRFEPMMRALARVVEDGRLGTLLNASVRLRCHRPPEYYRDTPWRGTWAGEGGSVLINQAVHFFDLLVYIAGLPTAAAAVFANRAHTGPRSAGGIETEDTLAASMTLAGGGLASFECTSASHLGWSAQIVLTGTAGAVAWDNRTGLPTADFADPAATADVDHFFRQTESAREAAVRAQSEGKGYYGPGHPAQIADFIDAVKTGRPPRITGETAARTMRALYAVYESARTGTRVAVAQPD